MNQEFLYIPSAFKEGKTYSAIPNVSEADLGGFTRGSSATRINEQGLIELVGNDVPRIDYSDGGCPKLLLEDSATNLITYSEDFTQWNKSKVSIQSDLNSPMIDKNSKRIIESTDDDRHRLSSYYSLESGKTYTFSIWAKSSDRNLVINAASAIGARAGFNLLTGEVSNNDAGNASIESFTNGWFLCSVTGNSTSSSSLPILVQMQIGTVDEAYAGDGVSFVSLFGAQLETGSVATSYIPTNGETAIRQADSGLQTGDIQSYIDSKKGSFEVDWKRIVTDDNGFTYLNLQGDNTDNRVQIYFKNNNQISTRIKTGGATEYNNNIAYNDGTFKLVRIDWQDGEMLSFVNNVLMANIEIDGFAEGALKKIVINNSDDKNAEIKSISVSKESDNLFNSWQEISNSLSNRGYRII